MTPEKTIERREDLKISRTVIRITARRHSHNYKMGECYIVSVLHPSEDAFTASSIDGGSSGNWIRFYECVIVGEMNSSGQFISLESISNQKNKGGSNKMDITDTKHLDKVVLPSSHKKAILETLAQEDESNRYKLFFEWGFEETFEKGKGIIFLFYGPPGTGKTLCAEMMAKYLKKDHIVMSTADIQSSVPGQAERNIRDMFEQAKKQKNLLVIDECDSLLYERNSVGAIMSAEINCLLSEIEKFDGVCVLTTNRNHKLDTALERRIALKLEFPKPSKDIRLQIWKTLLPEKCPISKCVSLEKLSRYRLCGGHIKNVIFGAARRAIHDKSPSIRMRDFELAINREKQGSVAFKEGRGRPIDVSDGRARVRSKTKGMVRRKDIKRIIEPDNNQE